MRLSLDMSAMSAKLVGLYQPETAPITWAMGNLEQLPDNELIQDMAVWDSYQLAQLSPDSFSIRKRTNDKSAWVDCAAGHRSPGMAFVGDTDGGLAIGMKDFWQLHPTAMEITNASTDNAQLTCWMWSPESPAMDLRHYDTKGHGLDASYEDYEPGFSTATGVARTHELTQPLHRHRFVRCEDQRLDEVLELEIVHGAGRRRQRRAQLDIFFACFGFRLGCTQLCLGFRAHDRVLEHLLSGVRPQDPLTYVLVAVVLGPVAFLAALLPARRAARIPPAVALRAD